MSNPVVHYQIAIAANNEAHNGSAVLGNSPVRYLGDTANNIFAIDSLDMYPNPCVMQVIISLKLKDDR